MSILEWARKVQAIAQTGLHFTQDPFDRDRYQKLQALVAEILATELEIPIGQARALWSTESGYATPKVGVRGGVFKDNKVLLVREIADGRWTIPGGWVDVNDSPSDAVVREIFEESGYHARATKLAYLVDKNKHPHPPGTYHVYNLYFVCDLIGGTPTPSNETDAVEFFPVDALPPLSEGRVLASQIQRVYEHHLNRTLPTDFD